MRRVGPILASFSDWPEDSVGDLVADVYYGRLDTLGLERVAHVERVLVYLGRKPSEIRGPTCRDLLLARVGPGVAEVQVDVDV